MKLEIGQIVDAEVRDYFNQPENCQLQAENKGLFEDADSRDESIKVYRQELDAEREKVRELKEALERIANIPSGAYVRVPTLKRIAREALGEK